MLASKFAWVVEVSRTDVRDGAWWASFMFLCFISQWFGFHYFVYCSVNRVVILVGSRFQKDYFLCLFAGRVRTVEVHYFSGIIRLELFLWGISFTCTVDDSIHAWGRTGSAGAGGFCSSWWRDHEVVCIRGCCYAESGSPGVSRTLKVFIVDDDCVCLGLNMIRDLSSEELEYSSFLVSDLTDWLCFKAASFDFWANVVALLWPDFLFLPLGFCFGRVGLACFLWLVLAISTTSACPRGSVFTGFGRHGWISAARAACSSK